MKVIVTIISGFPFFLMSSSMVLIQSLALFELTVKNPGSETLKPSAPEALVKLSTNSSAASSSRFPYDL